ncbi:MAG: hypothetical protein ACLQGJ_01545 [Candidatus Dormibacteria bacterium]
MDPRLGKLILGLSAAGYPLTELTIRKLGRRGAIITETVCVGLAARDAAMVIGGAPGRLRRGPALLLWLELAAAVAATGLGALRAMDGGAAERLATRPDAVEVSRRAAVATLFGLHTVRFRIYLQPDSGRKLSAS